RAGPSPLRYGRGLRLEPRDPQRRRGGRCRRRSQDAWLPESSCRGRATCGGGGSAANHRHRSPIRSPACQRVARRARNVDIGLEEQRPLAQLVAIYRNPSYSPLQHRVNDTAILDATVARLEAEGWRAIKTTEWEVERGRVPGAELYLNMCQGARAAEQLLSLESDGAVIVNRPSSALNCHRRRLVERLRETGLAFPRTLIHATSGPAP